jgi:hypothetical protein
MNTNYSTNDLIEYGINQLIGQLDMTRQELKEVHFIENLATNTENINETLQEINQTLQQIKDVLKELLLTKDIHGS